METIKVYAQTDRHGRITAAQSSIFLTDTTGWVQIDEGNGDKYAHAQSGYFAKPIVNFDGSHNYKLVDGLAVETTAAEQAEELAEKPPMPPTPTEVLQEENRLLRAQVQAATERQDFVEDCIAEMAAQVYV